MVKRLFDILFAIVSLIILLPVFLIISVIILFDSAGGVFYLQQRIGKNMQPFKLFKFRTMGSGAEKSGLITVGEKDKRITSSGYWLRKYKLDELPQLINILKGEMSVVGPRPEVEEYVSLYNKEQQRVLSVRPGLTDYASLEYVDESEILATYPYPQKAYVEEIMPAKLELNLKYIDEQGFFTDVRIIIKTIGKIIR